MAALFWNTQCIIFSEDAVYLTFNSIQYSLPSSYSHITIVLSYMSLQHNYIPYQAEKKVLILFFYDSNNWMCQFKEHTTLTYQVQDPKYTIFSLNLPRTLSIYLELDFVNSFLSQQTLPRTSGRPRDQIHSFNRYLSPLLNARYCTEHGSVGDHKT